MVHLTQQGPIERHSIELFQWELWGGGCTVGIEAEVAWVRTTRTSVYVMHRGFLVTEMGDYSASTGPCGELEMAIRVASMAAAAVGADQGSELTIEAWTEIYACAVVDHNGGHLREVPEGWLSTGFDGVDVTPPATPQPTKMLVWSSKNADEQNVQLLESLVQRMKSLDLPAVHLESVAQPETEPA
ncbi:MAG: hypothetical protein E6R08_00455 [Nevskiaceae bacterium]|nr:MAG: hypothetical protein E6R08_00455 [Nevskiaceae bacterium]